MTQLGDRYNTGKLPWNLLSWPALAELVKVLDFGSRKYSSWNWSKGLSWSDCCASMMRHLTAWMTGEDKDPETGLSHMAHVLCNAMFLMHFILFNRGIDDRQTLEQFKRGGPEVPSDTPEKREGSCCSQTPC